MLLPRQFSLNDKGATSRGNLRTETTAAQRFAIGFAKLSAPPSRSRPGEDLNHDAAMCTAIAKTSAGITYFVFPFAGPTGGGQIAALPFYSLRLPLFNSSHACETRLCSSPTISSIRCFNSGFIRKAKKFFCRTANISLHFRQHNQENNLIFS